VAKIDNIKKASQLARAIASDISIYNTQAIEDALKRDNFFTALAGELDEGRNLFHDKVSAELCENTNIFEKAIIDIIIAGRGHIKAPIW
jgi:predicted transcriptional regulator